MVGTPEKMKILVTGANGMLSNDVLELPKKHSEFSHLEFFPFTRKELNITDMDALISVVDEIKPQVVFNGAAFTKVDDCETAVGQEQANLVNGSGPVFLGDICREREIKLINISTDYVFPGNGTKPYKEDEETNPINNYGLSKLQGEKNTAFSGCDYLTFRTAWLYGHHGPNFVATMLKLAETHKELRVVNDQMGSPTWTGDLAYGIFKLLMKGESGLYHLTNSGQCTWYDFAVEIFRLYEKDVKVIPVSSDEFKRPAQRPTYSVLDNSAYENDSGYQMPSWQDALKRFKES